MAVTKTLIRSCSADNRSTASTLTHVNEVLSSDNDNCMFATLFVAICDTRTGALTYTNAGHNPPYIRRNDGQLVLLDKRHGPVAGALQGFTYGENKCLLNSADTLLMYTDGVTEAMNQAGEFFSERRLIELLGQEECQDAESVVNVCITSVHEFESGAAQADDITLLAFTYLGTQANEAKQASMVKTWHNLDKTAEVNTWFEGFARANGLDDTLSRKIHQVLDELVSNIIRHAYHDVNTGQLETRLTLCKGRLHITLSDNGAPFDPLSAKRPDLKRSLVDREIGGLGIYLVRKLMDEVSYKREGDLNVLRLSVGSAGSDSSPECSPEEPG